MSVILTNPQRNNLCLFWVSRGVLRRSLFMWSRLFLPGMCSDFDGLVPRSAPIRSANMYNSTWEKEWFCCGRWGLVILNFGGLGLDPPPLGKSQCTVFRNKSNGFASKWSLVVLDFGCLGLGSTSIRKHKMYGVTLEKQWFCYGWWGPVILDFGSLGLRSTPLGEPKCTASHKKSNGFIMADETQ